MDQPGLDRRQHEQALRGLRRVNLLSRSATLLGPHLRRMQAETPDAPLRVLDIACGGGDVPIALARQAAGARVPLQIDGCDISPVAVELARRDAESAGVSVRFFEQNVLRNDLPDGYDVVTCSLFLHHLDETDAVELLRRMAAAARRGILVDDLVRSRPGYLLAWFGSRLLSRSPIVHFDGPVSVAGAFTTAEVRDLATRAGLKDFSIRRHWPQRYLLAGRGL